MATQETRLKAALLSIRNKFNSITTAIGPLADLTTTARGSIVNALNEVDGRVKAISGSAGGATINDTTPSQTTTYSSTKSESRLSEVAAAVKADVLGGVGEATDTLSEFKSYVDAGQGADLTALANRLRIDQVVAYTADQKAFGIGNLGAVSIDAIGNPDADLAAYFEAGLA